MAIETANEPTDYSTVGSFAVFSFTPRRMSMVVKVVWRS